MKVLLINGSPHKEGCTYTALKEVADTLEANGIKTEIGYAHQEGSIDMSRRTEKRRYGKYNKFDVVYADFGKNPHGIQGGIRPGIIISCDASNHDGAPQVSVVPLSSKLKDIPVHVILNPKDVSGFGLSKISDFMPEDAQTISKGCIRAKSGTVIEDSGVREAWN